MYGSVDWKIQDYNVFVKEYPVVCMVSKSRSHLLKSV
jgi:NADPH:quinone reductase-like Zn-dependent oxidoreductase